MAGARAAVEGARQTRSHIVSRQNQAREQGDHDQPAQAMRIAGRDIGMGAGRCGTCPARVSRGAAPTRRGKMRRRPPARHGVRKSGDAQTRCRVPGGAPRQACAARRNPAKPSDQRQSDCGDGGGQEQRLQRPWHKGEQAGQRQGKIKTDKAQRRPEPRQHALDRQRRARQRDLSAPGGSVRQPVWDAVLGDEVGIGLPGTYDAPLFARDQDFCGGGPRIVIDWPSPRHRRRPTGLPQDRHF